MRRELVIIDPQIDFCDPTGKLFVPGAVEDMKRLNKMLSRNLNKFDDIHVTLDSHHEMDVAHPKMWKDQKGNNPAPFTLIFDTDVEKGIWTPVIPSLTQRMISYTKSLAKSGKFLLCVWPEHCLIGSTGAAIVPELRDTLGEWGRQNMATVDYVTKGSNIYTEHYGAFMAEVPDPKDPSTQLNTSLLKAMEEADELLWAGEAATHCVLNSMQQAFDNFGPDSIKKSVLLIDAMSSIAGPTPANEFKAGFDAFVDKYKKLGMKVAKTTDF